MVGEKVKREKWVNKKRIRTQHTQKTWTSKREIGATFVLYARISDASSWRQYFNGTRKQRQWSFRALVCIE